MRGHSHLTAARSKDGISNWEIDSEPTLLPRRINGEWALIHRPVGSMGAHMWISFSSDLKHWGAHKMMLEARRGAWWDANKIGLCNPLIETPRGWLVIYHGVRQTCAGCLYRLGLALFDLNSPETCLIRGDEWIFGAEKDYEPAGNGQKNQASPSSSTSGSEPRQ